MLEDPGNWLEPEWFDDEDEALEIFRGLREYARSKGIKVKLDQRIRFGGRTDGRSVIVINASSFTEAMTTMLHELIHLKRRDIARFETPAQLTRSELWTEMTTAVFFRWVGYAYKPMVSLGSISALPEVNNVVVELIEDIGHLFVPYPRLQKFAIKEAMRKKY